MASNAYPISAPAVFTGTGAIYFANTGAIDFNNQPVTDFVSSVQGDTFYVGTGGTLAALPLGSAGQYLKVNAGATGPVWATLPSEGPIFSAFSTTAGTAITGSSGWTTLDDTYVTWDMTDGVTGAAFDLSTGLFTAPDAGVYEFAASVAFQGNNTGLAVDLTNDTVLPGRATRQLALRVNGSGLVYAARQAEPSNFNDTQVAIYNAKLTLAATNTVSIAVRHDATTPLLIRAGTRTSFSGSRVR